MKRRPLVAAIGAVVAATLTLSGCAGSLNPASSGGNDSGAEITWPEPTASLDGVELTFWAAQSSAKLADSVIEPFEKETGAKVNVVVVPDPYEKNVQTKIATGDMPDLMFWQSTRAMLNSIRATDTLQNLDTAPWIPKLNDINKDAGALDGVHYAAIVQAMGTIGVFYSKDAFAEAGIDEVPTTYDEVMAAAKKLKAAGNPAPIFEVGGDKWPTQYAVQAELSDLIKDGLWDKMNKNEASFADPDVVDVISQYQDVFTSGLGNADYTTATFNDQTSAIYDGKAGMAFGNASFVNGLLAAHDGADVDEHVGFFAAGPTEPIGLRNGGQQNTVVAVKSGDADREAATRQLLSYWMGPGYEDYINAQSYLSVRTDVESPDSVPELTKTVANWPNIQPSMQSAAVASPDLAQNLAAMLAGTKTPQQVGDQTASQFSQIAAAQGIPGF